MQEIHLSTREAILYLAFIGAAAGLVIGLVPLIYGWKKGKTKLGIAGLVISIGAGGAISVLFSLLVMVVFVLLIVGNKLVNAVLGGSIVLIGIFLAALGFVKMNSAIVQAGDQIAYFYILGGLCLSMLGLTLLLVSIWPSSSTRIEDDLPGDDFN